MMPKPDATFKPTPRQALGWPCFYCAKTLKRCHGPNKSRKNRRCCGECKGASSH